MTRLIDENALLKQLKGTHAFLSHDDYVQEVINAPTVKREGWVSDDGIKFTPWQPLPAAPTDTE